MKKLILHVSVILSALFASSQFTFAYMAPHNTVSNDISCEDCHVLDRWDGGTAPLPYFLKPCELCHNNDTGGGYSRTSAPEVITHSYAAPGASIRFGNWVRDCWDCHGHKFAETPLATGTYNPTTDVTVNGGNTTFSVAFTSIDPKWDENDASWNQKQWSQKTNPERGLIFVVTYQDEAGFCSTATNNYCIQDTDCPSGETCVPEQKTTSFEIITKSNNDLTVQGDLSAFVADPANLFPIDLNGNFEIFYGQMIRPEVDGRPVNITDSTTFALNDALGSPDPLSIPPNSGNIDSTPDGICQVCHTQTNHWRNDGTGADHFQGEDCAFCHDHSQGFMPSCNTCHGYPPLVDSATPGPDALVYTPAPTGSQTAGAHEIHVGQLSGRSVDENVCDFCHISGMPITPVIGDPNGLQVDFYMTFDDGSAANDPDIYDGTNTSYKGQAGVLYDPTTPTSVANDGTLGNGSMTCSNVYCHSSGQSLIFGSQPIGESPAWDGSTLDPDNITCNNCHKEVPDNDLHEHHVLVRKFDCNYCHDATVTAADYPLAIPSIKDPSMHVNGRFDVIPSPTWDGRGQTGWPNPFTFVPAPGGGTCFFPTDGTSSCHLEFAKPITARWQTIPPASFCGNGIVEGNEACDDNNNNNFDACSNACKIQVLEGPALDCTDADGDSFVDITDSANGCYVTDTPTTAPPYDECDADPAQITATTYYEDLDGDGFGKSDVTMQSCTDPGSGWSPINSDCNDNDPLVQCDYFAFFPAIKDSPNTTDWRNFGTIQSRDPSISIDVTIHAYNNIGTECASSPQNFTIPSNGSQNFRPHLICDASGNTNFEGAIVVESLSPLLGTINTIASNTTAFNIYENTQPKTISFFPKVFDGINNWTNNLYIQNTLSNQTNITINVVDILGTTATSNHILPGNGKILLQPQVLFGAPINGSLSITSDNPVASMLRYEFGNAQAFTIYESMDSKLAHYFPRLKERADGSWRNFMSFQNVDPVQTATCTISVYDDAGTLAGTKGPVAIAPNSKLNTRPGRIADQPAQATVIDFDGHAIAICDLPVIGSVNTIAPDTDAFNIYESNVPNNNLYFPKVLDQFNQWVNEISVQNIDATPRNITVNFFDSAGSSLGSAGPVVIPAFGRYNVAPSTVIGGTVNGTAQVISDNPICSMIQYEWRLSTGLPGAFTIYEGIPQ